MCWPRLVLLAAICNWAASQSWSQELASGGDLEKGPATECSWVHGHVRERGMKIPPSNVRVLWCQSDSKDAQV